jgi:hypothetical protein
MELKGKTIVRLARRRPEVLAELHHELLSMVVPLLSELGGRLTPYCGFRGQKEQELAFSQGTSGARWGQSPHNFRPSLAVDLVLDPTHVSVQAHQGDPRFPDLWDDTSPEARAAWTDLEAAALRYGLERVSIGGKRDLPHLQLPEWRAYVSGASIR